jgi:hypothetical protein
VGPPEATGSCPARTATSRGRDAFGEKRSDVIARVDPAALRAKGGGKCVSYAVCIDGAVRGHSIQGVGVREVGHLPHVRGDDGDA